jgi:molybdopterin molybdotransferase
MELDIRLTDAPIPKQSPPAGVGRAGAWVEFRGLVRGEEEGQPIGGLEYEAYSPMAEREIRRILEDIAAHRPCLAARVIHRLGVVPVGEAAIYVGIAGRHRAEAFALLSEFMDRLKQDVPIWKKRAISGLDTVVQSRQPAAAGSGLDGPPAAASQPRPHSALEVVSLVQRLCSPLGTERVGLSEALGRVLREAVRAPEDQPPFDRSAVDGYAVRMDEPARQLRIVDAIRAGDWKPRVLQPGEAVRIATGGALPGDNLRVVMKEEAQTEADTLTVLGGAGKRNIRFRGEEARAGQILIEAGTVLTSGTIGWLAGLGCVQPVVTRLPRALHVATGNEIVPPERTPQHGQIRDSNSALVRAFLGEWGIAPAQLCVGEDEAGIRTTLTGPPAQGVDLLLISGGASIGDHDFTLGALERAGFGVHVRRTSARPGKPLVVAQRGSTLAFGLPGNPLAHFVCLHLYVRAALEAWAGQQGRAGFQRGLLADTIAAGSHERETFWPAHRGMENGTVVLTPLPWKSSGDLTALARANALIRLPAGTGQLARGSPVDFTTTARSA